MAECGSACGLGGGAVTIFRLGKKVHGDGIACGNVLFEGYTIIAGIGGIQIGREGAPFFAFIGYEYAAALWRIGV